MGGRGWSQLRAGYDMLLPCKQALGMWLQGPWRMAVQSLFKSALILDYSMCMIWTFKKENKKTQVRCSAPTLASGPAWGTATRSHQLPPSR